MPNIQCIINEGTTARIVGKHEAPNNISYDQIVNEEVIKALDIGIDAIMQQINNANIAIDTAKRLGRSASISTSLLGELKNLFAMEIRVDDKPFPYNAFMWMLFTQYANKLINIIDKVVEIDSRELQETLAESLRQQLKFDDFVNRQRRQPLGIFDWTPTLQESTLEQVGLLEGYADTLRAQGAVKKAEMAEGVSRDLRTHLKTYKFPKENEPKSALQDLKTAKFKLQIMYILHQKDDQFKKIRFYHGNKKEFLFRIFLSICSGFLYPLYKLITSTVTTPLLIRDIDHATRLLGNPKLDRPKFRASRFFGEPPVVNLASEDTQQALSDDERSFDGQRSRASTK